MEDHQPAQKPTVPPCPHQQILALYHELLPELPRVKVWTGVRQQHLAARWRERWKDGFYATQSEGLDYWRRLFSYIARCDFLLGKVYVPGRKPFLASLDWIARAENFAKIIEQRYENKESAQ